MNDLDKMINDACYWYYLRQFKLNERLVESFNIEDLKEKELTTRLIDIINNAKMKGLI